MSRAEPGIWPLAARICLVPIFLNSAVSKMFSWGENAQYMATRHITWPPLVTVMLGGALVIELFGGLALLLGYKARIAAVVMFFYMAAVSVIFHNFWAWEGMVAAENQTHFLKNMGIMGGLAMIAAYGAGRLSLDFRNERGTETASASRPGAAW